MESKTALVSGGAGFLGSHLCEVLLQEGYEVVCIDNFGSGARSNLQHLDSERLSIEEIDIRQRSPLPPTDEIYHLASRALPPDFTEYPVQIALTNTEGTRNLLDHAVACEARMVYASTSEVYGDPEIHPQHESYSGNVNIRGPRGCYDESKRFGETLTVAYEKKFDLDVRTARIFNTYGPRMRPDDGRVVPTFISQALENKPLTIHGDGLQTRSFCYVSDTVNGLRALMRKDGLQGEVINIGRQNENSIKELADMICELCGSKSNMIHEPRPPDDPSRRKPDLQKANELLDWSPSVPLDEGLNQTIGYFQKL